MVTIYDIAKQAGVSAMTVSRVINNTGRISEATRIRVKQVMEEMNYVPNTVARSLVLQQTKILSLLITDITNPFYTTLARGAEDAAMRLGYRLLFGNSDENLTKEKEYVDMILSTRVDGVLFAPAGDESLDHLHMLDRHRIPYVLLDREVPGLECDSVVGDSKDGARRLVTHLIEQGHRRIALLGGSLNVSTARQRLVGYEEALKHSGLPVDPVLIIEAGYTLDQDNSAASAVDLLLQLADPPTAIFAANNFIALGAIRALRNRGLEVPRDMSLVCYDDLSAASVIDPFLTVAAQPAYEFGYKGIELLIDLINDTETKEPTTITLPSELILRNSVQKRPI